MTNANLSFFVCLLAIVLSNFCFGQTNIEDDSVARREAKELFEKMLLERFKILSGHIIVTSNNITNSELLSSSCNEFWFSGNKVRLDMKHNSHNFSFSHNEVICLNCLGETKVCFIDRFITSQPNEKQSIFVYDPSLPGKKAVYGCDVLTRFVLHFQTIIPILHRKKSVQIFYRLLNTPERFVIKSRIHY
jgi:hypothetical protein